MRTMCWKKVGEGLAIRFYFNPVSYQFQNFLMWYYCHHAIYFSLSFSFNIELGRKMITVQWSDPYTFPMMKFWHLWAIFEWVPVDLEFKNGTSMSEAHCYETSVYPFLTFRWVKDICKKIFQLTIFFSFYCRQIMSYLCQKCKKNWGSPSSFQR